MARPFISHLTPAQKQAQRESLCRRIALTRGGLGCLRLLREAQGEWVAFNQFFGVTRTPKAYFSYLQHYGALVENRTEWREINGRTVNCSWYRLAKDVDPEYAHLFRAADPHV